MASANAGTSFLVFIPSCTIQDICQLPNQLFLVSLRYHRDWHPRVPSKYYQYASLHPYMETKYRYPKGRSIFLFGWVLGCNGIDPARADQKLTANKCNNTVIFKGFHFFRMYLVKKQLQTKSVLQTGHKLHAASQESTFGSDHPMFVHLELATYDKVPLVFRTLGKRILNCGRFFIVQCTINVS